MIPITTNRMLLNSTHEATTTTITTTQIPPLWERERVENLNSRIRRHCPWKPRRIPWIAKDSYEATTTTPRALELLRRVSLCVCVWVFILFECGDEWVNKQRSMTLITWKLGQAFFLSWFEINVRNLHRVRTFPYKADRGADRQTDR